MLKSMAVFHITKRIVQVTHSIRKAQKKRKSLLDLNQNYLSQDQEAKISYPLIKIHMKKVAKRLKILKEIYSKKHNQL